MSDKDSIYNRIGVSKDQLQKLAIKYNLDRIAVFGSFARGEEKPDSDVDFLINWGNDPRDLNRVFGFQEDAENLIGRKIDMVSEDFIYHHLREIILSEAKDLV